ncbi:hypothetical protein KAFR_0A02950 [Kazachstania africana CBS 2517]|uniref:Uncharacterized protein n=1 Tax=Kazachstania africana (strain ATCC 22294 / BCRC 22015 / CBS 2517 / CECT 1963 / NBRC 1671 / NRRL Y-8276) TaxID=1071382 RepID=H2AMY1_KAZAF|nr:hypothetical protein KAFR_0A02950 [Kazachstania africana CBS 2517]CCF55731.1 hypothetical protein KAFR_0A02950 [Kazachstania africana CBS 2517]
MSLLKKIYGYGKGSREQTFETSPQRRIWSTASPLSAAYILCQRKFSLSLIYAVSLCDDSRRFSWRVNLDKEFFYSAVAALAGWLTGWLLGCSQAAIFVYFCIFCIGWSVERKNITFHIWRKRSSPPPPQIRRCKVSVKNFLLPLLIIAQVQNMIRRIHYSVSLTIMVEMDLELTEIWACFK